MLAALLLFTAVSASDDPSGRYAHCSIIFADHMVVYGGRGFVRSAANEKSLVTLGCARPRGKNTSAAPP